MLIDQVKLLLSKSYFINRFQCLHDSKRHVKKALYPLENRSLLKISGEDASIFLQGLITNDMRHFDSGARSIYAMFLNNKGRVLYDTLIHEWDAKTAFMVECDKSLHSMLLKHLKMFKLRRNIRIEDVNNDYKVWVLISPNELDTNSIDKNVVNIYKDPRLVELGHRIISPKVDVSKVANAIGSDIDIKTDEVGYQYLRYTLGVSEGAEDLPPSTSFPLEANCDYLHGVSFHKGCYIGQEVTARVHHTGVVRKRIMPFKFSEILNKNFEKESVITAANNPKINLGKLKGVINDYGLGLLRIKETIDAKTISVDNCIAEPFKPLWWPLEAPKEIPKSNENVLKE